MEHRLFRQPFLPPILRTGGVERKQTISDSSPHLIFDTDYVAVIMYVLVEIKRPSWYQHLPTYLCRRSRRLYKVRYLVGTARLTYQTCMDIASS